VAYAVRLRGVYNEQQPTDRTQPGFLREYKTAVLLELAQSGYLTQEECLRCIGKLNGRNSLKSTDTVL